MEDLERLRPSKALERSLRRFEMRIACLGRNTKQVGLCFGARSGKGIEDTEQEMSLGHHPEKSSIVSAASGVHHTKSGRRSGRHRHDHLLLPMSGR